MLLFFLYSWADSQKKSQKHSLSFPLASWTRVCPSFISSVSGGDQTKKPISVARWTLQASRLRTTPPHSNSGAVPKPPEPPPCPPLPPPPLLAETADTLQYLHSTAGQVMYKWVYELFYSDSASVLFSVIVNSCMFAFHEQKYSIMQWDCCSSGSEVHSYWVKRLPNDVKGVIVMVV